MRSDPIVERPRPGAEAPRPWTVIAVGALGLVMGLWLVAGTLHEGRPIPEEDAPPPTPADPATDTDTDTDPATDTDPPTATVADTDTAADTDPATDTDAAADTDPATATDTATDPAADTDPATAADPATPPDPASGPPPATGSAPGRVVRGRVAYLRCEGVPLQDGPYPCPRDRALEEAVWAALDDLPRCPTAPERAGGADVRLHFRGRTAPELLLLERATDLDGPRLLACLREPLGALRTELTPEHMVVSFRFRLENR